MKKIIIISGPTASGKTKLALKIAKKYDGELISADSRQVYSKMDVVTGKDLSAKSKIIKASFYINKQQLSIKPHELGLIDCDTNFDTSLNDINFAYYDIEGTRLWGLDIVNPNQKFDVSHFIYYCGVVLNNIWDRNKIPILVGGTGFWIRSLLQQPETIGVSINKELRQELEKYSVSQLQDKLKNIDITKWKKMNKSDQNNPRRLVRAIEVAKEKFKRRTSELKNVLFSNEPNHENKIKINREIHKIKLIWLGLKMDKNILAEKIRTRVLDRIKNGAIEETQNLAIEYGWEFPSMTGIGYQDLKPLIEDKIDQEKATQNWVLHETQYAKRQMTWFTKERQITWFDMQDENIFAKIKENIEKLF